VAVWGLALVGALLVLTRTHAPRIAQAAGCVKVTTTHCRPCVPESGCVRRWAVLVAIVAEAR
jgi:hypothetical protein